MKHLPIDDLKDFDFTHVERTALLRLSENKDWTVLVSVMSRYMGAVAIDLLGAPTEDQNVILVRRQGGLDFFRKMVEFVEGKDE